MILKFNNIESIIFYDKKVQQILPELLPIFQKWTFGIRSGARSVAKDALLDFINKITPEQLDRIGSYLGTPITLQKINPNLTKIIETDINNLNKDLEINNFHGNVNITRRGELIYLCLWR